MRSAQAITAFSLVVLASGGCARTPSARVDAHTLDGPRPPQVALRCRARGLKAPVQYQWKLANGVHVVGWNAPTNEPWTLVQPPDPPGAAWAECDATGSDGTIARVQHALGPLRITAASTTGRAGTLVVVHGSGFGPSRGEDDGVWLVPEWGRARAADASCQGAQWSDAVISACVPATLPAGAWQLRVQAGGELASAPAPLEVKP